MNVQRIPKKLLIHNITVIEQGTKQEYAVNNVLMQLHRGLVYSISGEEIVANSYLYVDEHNSDYDSLAIFKSGNIVVYEGERYTMKGIRYETAFGAHHLKILIV